MSIRSDRTLFYAYKQLLITKLHSKGAIPKLLHILFYEPSHKSYREAVVACPNRAMSKWLNKLESIAHFIFISHYIPALSYRHIKPNSLLYTSTNPKLPGGVSTISEDSLAGNPLALSAKEANNRCDILNHGQATVHAICLVECDSFGGFLRVEECY